VRRRPVRVCFCLCVAVFLLLHDVLAGSVEGSAREEAISLLPIDVGSQI
jgi:hypothetical protein